MTEAERTLIEAALAWRRLHGPATAMTSSAMTEVAHSAEDVIRERELMEWRTENELTIKKRAGVEPGP